MDIAIVIFISLVLSIITSYLISNSYKEEFAKMVKRLLMKEDYSKNHPHIREIIEICLENDRLRYEDLLQIDILDPTTNEFKFELMSRFIDKLTYRIGELELNKINE